MPIQSAVMRVFLLAEGLLQSWSLSFMVAGTAPRLMSDTAKTCPKNLEFEGKIDDAGLHLAARSGLNQR